MTFGGDHDSFRLVAPESSTGVATRREDNGRASSTPTPSLQQSIEPLVGGLAFGFGEVVRGVGGGELEMRVRRLGVEWLEQGVDFLGLREGFADAVDVEVAVVHGELEKQLLGARAATIS